MISQNPEPLSAAQWWNDAVVYQIYPRSFYDANGDGEGDLQGVIDKLDYLQELGVNALWLSPFYPSPLADGGYDVADYCGIDPRFGNLDQFDDLVAKAHARNIKIIADIVPNHTSDQHPWFQQALADGPESSTAARYVFRRGKGEHGELPPTNWLSNFGGSAWQPCGDGWYYLHLFAREQPDLNWDNPAVREDFLRFLKFWCDRGVDGFRIDVSHGLVKDLSEPLRDRIDPTLMSPQSHDGSDPLWDRDGVHEVYRQWRELFNQYEPAKYAVGESWTPFSKRIFTYAQPDELGAVFDFSLSKAVWERDAYVETITRTHDYALQAGTAPTWVLGNHDVPRVASRLGLPAGASVEQWVTSNGTSPQIDDALALRRARAAALILLGLPGTVFMYQGDELGLPEDLEIPESAIQDPNWERTGHKFKGRDGCRVPLPWDETKPTFGFNASGRSWLPQPEWFAKYAVSRETSDTTSLLNVYRQAIALRSMWVAARNNYDFSWLSEISGDAMGWQLPSGLQVITNFSDDMPYELAESKHILLSSDGSTDTTTTQIPPTTTVWCVNN